MWWLSFPENFTLHHCLHYLKSCRSKNCRILNLPYEFSWLFAVGICGICCKNLICCSYLPRLLAMGICCGFLRREFVANICRSCLPWEFAVDLSCVCKQTIFLCEQILFLCKQSFLNEYKPSSYENESFIFHENFFFNSVSFYYCRGSYGPT